MTYPQRVLLIENAGFKSEDTSQTAPRQIPEKSHEAVPEQDGEAREVDVEGLPTFYK